MEIHSLDSPTHSFANENAFDEAMKLPSTKNEPFVELLLSEYANWSAEIMSLLQKNGEDHLQLLLDVIAFSIVDRNEAAMLWGYSLDVAYVDSLQSVRLKQSDDFLSYKDAKRLQAVCLYRIDDVVSVCMVHPKDEASLQEIRNALGCEISPLFGLPDQIEQAIELSYGLGGGCKKAQQITESLPDAIDDGTLEAPAEHMEQQAISSMFKAKKKKRRR